MKIHYKGFMREKIQESNHYKPEASFIGQKPRHERVSIYRRG